MCRLALSFLNLDLHLPYFLHVLSPCPDSLILKPMILQLHILLTMRSGSLR